jgi:hypothetical protein
MTLKPLDIKSRPLIVAVVSGGCHFSQDADGLSRRPQVVQALAENAVYVDPSRYSLHLERIAENNKTQVQSIRPLQGIRLRGMDFRDTPHHFLEDGRVVHEVLGMGPDITARLQEGLTGGLADSIVRTRVQFDLVGELYLEVVAGGLAVLSDPAQGIPESNSPSGIRGASPILWLLFS